MKISQDELERERAAERLRAQWFQANLENDNKVTHEELRAARELLQAAEEQARTAQEQARTAQQAGIEKGRRIGRIQMLQQLLGQPETSSEQLHQRIEEDLAELELSLKQQLAARKPTNGTPSDDKT